MGNAAAFIDETSHPGVRCAHHRPPRFNAAEHGVCKMLAGTSRAQKPAVVCHVGEKIGTAQDKLAGELTDRVLKADQGSNATMVFRKLKDGELMADIEIFGHLITCDLCDAGKGIAQLNVFAKRHVMNFAVELDRRRWSD